MLKLLETFPEGGFGESDRDGIAGGIEDYAVQVEHIAMMAGDTGYWGLRDICLLFQEKLTALKTQGRRLTDIERGRLQEWPALVIDYLQSPGARRAGEALVRHLQNPAWSTPLPAEEAAVLQNLLSLPPPALAETTLPGGASAESKTLAAAALVALPAASILPRPEVELETRQQQARPEDISLQLPGDIHPELLVTLVQELLDQTAAFSLAIQCLSEGGGTLKDVQAAQRIAHTLKGAGQTVGIRGIVTLSHYVEDILLALFRHSLLPDHALAGTLLNAADCLESMSEALLGLSPPPLQALEVLQAILDWANRIDREGLPPAAAASALQAPRSDRVEEAEATAVVPPIEVLPLGHHNETDRVEAEAAVPAVQQALIPMLRIPALRVDDWLRWTDESLRLSRQIQEQVRKTRASLSAASSKLQGLSSPIEDSLAVLEALVSRQGRLQQEIQETLLRTRWVPVQTIVPRLQRNVRQTCRLTAKKAELRITGADTLMDSRMLNDLVNPLMHLLCNAVDHGIEPPYVRRSLGKEPVGRIVLTFVCTGEAIVVYCQDDGAGLDFQAIRRAAERRGLLRPEQALAENELSRLILLPGFSTRTEMTQTSGRGIGMDVVYSRLLALQGSLRIQSTTGQGCLMEMWLPIL